MHHIVTNKSNRVCEQNIRSNLSFNKETDDISKEIYNCGIQARHTLFSLVITTYKENVIWQSQLQYKYYFHVAVTIMPCWWCRLSNSLSTRRRNNYEICSKMIWNWSTKFSIDTIHSALSMTTYIKMKIHSMMMIQKNVSIKKFYLVFCCILK